MSWTYEPGASSKDKVRLLIGDTDSAHRQMQDEELAFFLGESSSIYVAAGEACKALAALYARQVDKEVGDLKVRASQRQKHYLDLAKQLRSRASRAVLPSAGGISVSDMQAAESDTDRVVPSFRRGQHDYYTSSTST